MGTTFKASKKVLRDYYPPGVSKYGHIPGIDCDCNPYEAELETTWQRNDKNERIGCIIEVTVNHRQFVDNWESHAPVVPLHFADDKLPPGTRDLVGKFHDAEARTQQRVEGDMR